MQGEGELIFEDLISELPPKGFPISKEELQNLIIAETEANELDVYRTSPSHVRSVERRVAGFDNFIWQDENGIKYSGLSIKGGNWTMPRIQYPANMEGFRYFGLEIAKDAARTIKMQKRYAQLGVPTERVIAVLMPKFIYMPDGRKLTQEEYKVEVRASFQTSARSFLTTEAELDQFLEEDIIIVLRAMPISFRLNDFKHLDADMIVDSFNKEVNKLQLLGMLPFDIDLSDGKRVFKEYLLRKLPIALGKNLATLHSNKITHGSLHLGNIGLDGSIVDLDTSTEYSTDSLEFKKELTSELTLLEDDLKRFLNNFQKLGLIAEKDKVNFLLDLSESYERVMHKNKAAVPLN